MSKLKLCEFCLHERDPFAPCSLPPEAHLDDVIEIHSGPDREGNYSYTRYWWREDTKRQRAQVFCSTQDIGTPAWVAAWRVYRAR